MDSPAPRDEPEWEPWGANRPPTLPSFSRAFGMLHAVEDAPLPLPLQDRFFIPSYLTGSSYVHKLEEAHMLKAAKGRDPKQTATNGSSTTSFTPAALPPGSHRGLAHNVVERPPPDEEDALSPLPTGWNENDMWGSIDVLSGGLDVKYTGPKVYHDRDRGEPLEAFAIRANHHMPPQCGIYYYEVQILGGKKDDLTVSIGFATKNPSLSRPIGWESESWGYHGDDGKAFSGTNNPGSSYGPSFNMGDTIGCGVNFRNNVAFFTRNGQKLGEVFHDVGRHKLYPAVSLRKPGEVIRANFGQTPFVFNIDGMVQEYRTKIQAQISAAPTTDLEPGMIETDLIQTLVLQFLQHDGYVETARAFAEDMKVQNEALNLDPSVKIAGVNIKDDEDANNRQRIRRAILEGDIDRALKYTNAYYPRVLQDNEQVYFKLRCRRFIEMVRKAAQLRMVSDQRKSNGHGPNMELDFDNSGWAETMETDDAESQAELFEVERDMLDYGQMLQAEYASDPRREVNQALGEIWSLVAYSNPLKEPQVSHLLDRKGRVAVSEELNSAILLSLGKSSRAALETLYAQTSVLLDDLRQEGGDGCFVSVKDVVDEIPFDREG